MFQPDIQILYFFDILKYGLFKIHEGFDRQECNEQICMIQNTHFRIEMTLRHAISRRYAFAQHSKYKHPG